jgi:HEAT repeat protein
VESAVIETIVRIDPEGKVCLPALVAALGGEAADCSAAASALGLFGPRAKSAIPALAKTIMRKLDWNAQIDNEGHPLVDAAKALWRIGPAATSTAIPTLIRAIESPRFITDGVLLQRDEEIDDKTAATAAHVLGLFGPEARQAVPVLIRCLEDLNNDQPNWELRREAALALGRIGPDAVSAIPILRTVLAEEIKSGHSETFADREMSISSAALIALWKLSPVDRARVENRLAESHSLTERAMVLGAIGRQSLEGELLTRRRVKALDNAIAEGKREGNMTPFVEEYFERISELGAGAHTAIPRLTELEKHENPWIRQWAGEALATIIRSNAAAR